MKVTSVKRYAEPNFPAHSILDEHPEMLHIIPKRWQKNRLLLAALAGVCILSAGCKKQVRVHLVGAQAMPVFISEAEGRQIVIEEARKAGISFKADNLTVRVANPSYKVKSRKIARSINLTLDGTDTKRNILYEYISREDYRQIYHLEPDTDKDMANAAIELKNELRQGEPGGRHGVFYEPIMYNKASNNKFAQEQLRAQVRDFIKWLKSEGVI